MATYLTGEKLAFKLKSDRVKLIGKRVEYLRHGDIDRSGRGYFFPKLGTVTGAEGVNLIIDEYTYLSRSEIYEIVEKGLPHD